MRRRDLVVLAGGILAAAANPVRAQQQAKLPRIGYLTSGNSVVEAFRHGLRDFGYVDGDNIAIELRGAEFKLERLPVLAAELAALPVDVMVTVTTPAAIAAKNATSSIPIVMATAGDPIGSGLIQSLARPGGNITGLSFQGEEVFAKSIELLKQAAAQTAKLALITNPDIEVERRLTPLIAAAAQRLGIDVRPFAVRQAADFDGAFGAIREWPAQAFSAVESALVTSGPSRARILDFAARERLPTVFGSRVFAIGGALLAYGIDFSALQRRSAYFVDRILRGAKPADLPVEQPTKFELVVNLNTAKALGLTVPQSLLARADEVIE